MSVREVRSFLQIEINTDTQLIIPEKINAPGCHLKSTWMETSFKKKVHALIKFELNTSIQVYSYINIASES